jgi:hypothetical protein
MPTVDIFPDITINNDWTVVGTGAAHEVLLDSDFSNYLKSDTNTEYFEMELGGLDSVGLNIDTITSIQVHMLGDHSARGSSSTVTCDYRNSSGIINSYTEDIALSTAGAIHDTPFTARTTSDGSDLWEDDDIEDMRFRVTMRTVDTGGAYTFITQMYLTVTYTELAVVIPTYSSDDNAIIKNGLITLKNGIVVVK